MKIKTIIYAAIGLILAYGVAVFATSDGFTPCYSDSMVTCACTHTAFNESVECHATSPGRTLPETSVVEYVYPMPPEAEEACSICWVNK
jgi:hypothetical protein